MQSLCTKTNPNGFASKVQHVQDTQSNSIQYCRQQSELGLEQVERIPTAFAAPLPSLRPGGAHVPE